MSADWYAVHTQPHKEDVAWRLLRTEGFEVFFPRVRVNPVNPRAKHIRPYFPGYLFLHVDLQVVGLSTFHYMPYVHGLVCFGGEAAHVPEALIHAIQRRVQQVASSGGELFDGLKSGDPILVRDGPFDGYGGMFDARLPGKDRVRVLLELLSGRMVPVELAAAQIVRMTARAV